MTVDAASLQVVPVLAGLDDDTTSYLVGHMQEVTVPVGGHLVKAGDFAYRFFAILEGSAVVERDGSSVATLETGDVFGEMALLDDIRRNADVVASSWMRVAALMSWDFRDAMDRFAEFRRRIDALVAERTR
ncbi:MAG: cyclic nucleotide-binding domain-containing protein [Actinomycetota bacterium]